MNVRNRPAEDGTVDLVGKSNKISAFKDRYDGRSSLILPPFDPDHEARLRAWAEGWDACRAWLQPELDRANQAADYWFERFHNPGKKLTQLRERRMREAAQAHWNEFVGGGDL